jgi:SHS2 domain-containing protein
MNRPHFTPYTILGHSGDLKIVGRGCDLLEALANASLGLVSQIVRLEEIEEREERAVTVRGEEPGAQAIAFLNELLFLIYGRHWLPRRVKTLTRCSRKGCTDLDAVLVGEPVDPARHLFKYEIKAVTYHEFSIETEDGITSIHFLCDL